MFCDNGTVHESSSAHPDHNNTSLRYCIRQSTIRLYTVVKQYGESISLHCILVRRTLNIKSRALLLVSERLRPTCFGGVRSFAFARTKRLKTSLSFIFKYLQKNNFATDLYIHPRRINNQCLLSCCWNRTMKWRWATL